MEYQYMFVCTNIVFHDIFPQ